MAEQQVDEFAGFAQGSGSVDTGKPDEFSQFQSASPTFSEKAGTFAQGGVRGAVTMTGTTAGLLSGVAAGAPAGPGGMVVGGLVGAGLGYFAGEQASQGLADMGVTYGSIEDVDPRLRPYAVGGETFGGGFSVGQFPLLAARLGISPAGKYAVGNALDDLINYASKSPLSYTATEAGFSASASLGGAAAEFYDPGDHTTRAYSEMAAGFVNPGRLVKSTYNGVVNTYNRVSTTISQSGRENAAAKILREVLEQHGEDPVLVARLLKANDIEGVQGLTAAQKTGSPALAALEQKLGDYSRRFGAESEQAARDGLDSIRLIIAGLNNTGDPQALQAAARLQRTYYRTLLAARVQEAENAAIQAASKISQDTPAAREQLSITAREALGSALKDARQVESELWGLVDKTQPANFQNLAAEYQALRSSLLKEVRDEKMPAIAKAFLKRFGAFRDTEEAAETVEQMTAGELTQFRSEMLERARQLTQAGDFAGARIHSKLAEAALDDLDGAYRGAASGSAYDEARAFSRELNEAFTRSFAGKATAEGRFGERIAPELLLRRAFATGKESGNIQLQELEEATRFLVTQGVRDTDESVTAMLNSQERILRLAAADTIDPETGVVSTKALSRFIRDNESLLNRFPEVKTDLEKAVTSEAARKNIESMSKNSMGIIEKQTAFGRLAELDGDPVVLAEKALLSPNQDKELMQLVRIAKKGSQETKDGLKASVFDAAYRRASNEAGVVDLPKLKNLLFNPSTPGRKSPIETLKNNGILSKQDVDNLEKLFAQADRILGARRPGTAYEIPATPSTVFEDLLTRIAGSSIATTISKTVGGGGGGQSIIIAGAGSRAARQVVEKIPMGKTRQVLIEAMTNPDLMNKLLMKIDSPQAQMEQARQLNAYFIQAGIYNTMNMISPDDPQQSIIYGP